MRGRAPVGIGRPDTKKGAESPPPSPSIAGDQFAGLVSVVVVSVVVVPVAAGAVAAGSVVVVVEVVSVVRTNELSEALPLA